MHKHYPSSITKDQFKAAAKERGWSLSNLAWRWGISLEHLLREIANSQRNTRWDDALRGLPVLSRNEAAEIRLQRLADRQSTPSQPPSALTRKKGPGYRYSDVLTVESILYVLNDLGEIPEGTEGIVRKVDDNGCQERYFIEFDEPYGAFWMTADEIDAYLVASGQTR